MEERIYTVPLGDAYRAIRNKRAPKAVKILRQFISKNMKAEEEAILISNALNSFIWEKSIQKPPRRVKIRVIKGDEVVNAYLHDEKIEEPKKEEKKAEKPVEKKEEPKAKEEKPKEVKKAESTASDAKTEEKPKEEKK